MSLADDPRGFAIRRFIDAGYEPASIVKSVMNEPELELTMATKDLDETRRLLYMVKAYRRTEKAELVGTLVNALAHHEGNLGLDPDDTMARLVGLLDVRNDSDADQLWLWQQIEALTAKLEETS